MQACSYPPCERIAMTRGLCKTHYEQQRKGRPLAPIIARAANGTHGPACLVHKCSRPTRAHGYCSTHLWQLVYSKERALKEVRRFRPGEWGKLLTDSNGYRFRARSVNGRVEKQFEHRRVMEEHLGRPLLPQETVHHKNGRRDQNDLGNLELWSSCHPSGQRVSDLVSWAREILATYDA